MAFHKILVLPIIMAFVSCKTDKREIVSKWDNGVTKVERIYSDTPNYFIENHYYENGQLASETEFIRAEKNGKSVAFYQDGKLLGKCTYKNGKINGEVTEFHKTGSLMFKGNQVNGELVGNAVHYYDNGKPEKELFYKDNKALLVNYWDSSGNKRVIGGTGSREFQDYLEQDKNGKDTTFDVLVIAFYKDSLRDGVWKFYKLADKKLILERTFEKDKIISDKWK